MRLEPEALEGSGGAAGYDDEAVLVAAARSGDAAAYERLVGRYGRRVFRLAQNITQNREDAEDVLQETFLKVFSHLGGFQGNSRFSTWLTRIAINQALMKLRRRHGDVLPLDEPVETEDGPLPREIVDWGPTPEQRYSQTELSEIMAKAVSRLSPGLRVVFQLRDVEELSTEETAQLLGISVPAVKSRASRARLALREELNRYFGPARRLPGMTGGRTAGSENGNRNLRFSE